MRNKQYRNDPNISRMSRSLSEAFVLHPDNCQILLKIYNVTTVERLFEQWIIESLMHPDDDLAQVLLPQLVSRFIDHLEQMRRKEWLR